MSEPITIEQQYVVCQNRLDEKAFREACHAYAMNENHVGEIAMRQALLTYMRIAKGGA